MKGARCLPAKWTNYLDWIEVVQSKELDTGIPVVIYGYEHDDAEPVSRLLEKAGFSDVSIYDHFFDEWLTDKNLPVEQLKNYPKLVPAGWLYAIQKGETVPHFDNNKLLILHAHYRNRDAYLSGHIPGAIDIDTLSLEAPETWNRRSPGEIKKALEDHGITADTTVVLYGKYMFPDNNDDFPGSAAGDIGAMRCALIMMYAGVKDVRILNGGFQSWLDAGYEISTTDVSKVPVAEFGISVPQHPGLIVDLPQAKAMLASEKAELVCVRSWPEYIGEVSGYNYIEKKGRIPGAVFGNCGSDAYHMENYRNPDHTTREYHEIEAIWKQAGITPDKHLAFYCGTGWRGSEAFINAWLLGWPKISLFDGGWFEWSNDPENPFETGIPFVRK